jgi:hypothetical protein
MSQPIREELMPAAKSFIQQIQWRGLFMIETLRDRLGNAWFVELNGRAWGSMALSRRQGLEYPAWNVEFARTERAKINVKIQSDATLVCRHLAREFMHLLFVLRGPRSSALREWPSFWKTFRDVVRVRRSDGIYNWSKHDPKVLLSDCYCTITDNVFKAKSTNSC